MERIALSLLGGAALAVLILELIALEVQAVLHRRRYTAWRGILTRCGIVGTWFFLFLRYVRVQLCPFVASFLLSYFVFLILFASIHFGRASHGRNP
jgi:hypothetical protein|uniref:Uncharacterized protein n=1 Tax=Candidatus Caldatribacterium californiense TaxID=1454726 RepID=A0A7V4DEF6_9BACT